MALVENKPPTTSEPGAVEPAGDGPHGEPC
jgi:hypothetical protein